MPGSLSILGIIARGFVQAVGDHVENICGRHARAYQPRHQLDQEPVAEAVPADASLLRPFSQPLQLRFDEVLEILRVLMDKLVLRGSLPRLWQSLGGSSGCS
jgi:hypothetical protein